MQYNLVLEYLTLYKLQTVISTIAKPVILKKK